MKLYSTKSKKIYNLKEAILNGLCPDGGLFMPTKIPKFEKNFFKKIEKLNFQEISFEVAKKFFPDIPEKELKKIIKNSISFDAPLKKLSENLFTLELFHGPTLAFKDFGARFMAQLMLYFLKNKKIIILAATSGDTGSAVGHGFFEAPNINIILLYPSGKVSQIQEKQLTTIGKNVTALEVKGTFDDCQKMVKEAFVNTKLKNELAKKNIYLSSANSINIARLLPQSFYYFHAYAQLKKLPNFSPDKKIVISVPSGNFGNLTAGLIAKKMGLPISKFIAATNANNTFPNYLRTGKFKPKNSVQTISNAMDVGNPNNFPRILELYKNNLKSIKKDVLSESFSDKETKEAIKEVKKNYNYLMDPHGAVAYLGLKKFLKKNEYGIFFETAHPSKFLDIVEPIIKEKIKIPAQLKKSLSKKKKSIKIESRPIDMKLVLKCFKC